MQRTALINTYDGGVRHLMQPYHLIFGINFTVEIGNGVNVCLSLQEDPAASAAIAATMAQLDWNGLLKAVDDGFRTWRKPSLLLFGANDPFVNVQNAFDFLDSKRTSMRLVTATAKVGLELE